MALLWLKYSFLEAKLSTVTLSIFKIPKSDSRAQKKLDAIPKAKPITKSDLDKIYFPAYVTDSYKIGTGKSRKAGRTVYWQVNPKYFAAKDKEVIKDNTALKEQIVTILKTTVAQKEAHNEWKGIFGDDEVFRKYLVYEASSGCFKFTGKLNDKKPTSRAANACIKSQLPGWQILHYLI